MNWRHRWDDRETLVREWLAHLESGGKDEATLEAFIQMSFSVDSPDDLDEAWDLMLEGIRLAPSEKILGIIGAGTLENLLSHRGADLIDRVEQQAAADPRFAFALEHAWRHTMSDDVWARVSALQREARPD